MVKVGNIYVSYSWVAEKEKHVVDKLEAACKKHDIVLKRDRNDINYKDSIREFMNQLAAGDAVILVLSEGYFKSPYCMYELREIGNNQNFSKRVFPIVLQGTPLYDPVCWANYLAYWERKKIELDNALSMIERTAAAPLYKALDDYADYRRLLAQQLDILADMNTLTEDIQELCR